MARTRRNAVWALACIAPAAVTWPILLAASARASTPLEVMAFDGQPVPGAAPGLVYSGFSNPVVNASGDVAFWGFVIDPQLAIGGTGLFGPDANGDPALIALDFEQVPGMPPGTEFRFVGTYFPRLDDAGAVAFRAGLSGPGVQYPANSGIWGWNAESGLALLAIAGDPVPEAGPGATLGSIPSSIDNPTIASEADIGFHGSFDDGSGASLTGAFALGEAGALTLVAGAGFEVPGIPRATFTWFRERRLTSC